MVTIGIVMLLVAIFSAYVNVMMNHKPQLSTCEEDLLK